MANFFRSNRPNRGPGRDSYGPSRESGRPATMHPAVCSQCGRDCEVPFRPTGTKPVLCSSCFEASGGREGRDSRPPRREFQGRSEYRSEDKPMFDAVCDSCGNNCKVPFQPRNGKPVYCSNCFGEQRGNDDRRSPSRGNLQLDYTEQLESINRKLDKIMKMLAPGSKKKAPPLDEVLQPTTPSEEIVVTDIVGEPVKD